MRMYTKGAFPKATQRNSFTSPSDVDEDIVVEDSVVPSVGGYPPKVIASSSNPHKPHLDALANSIEKQVQEAAEREQVRRQRVLYELTHPVPEHYRFRRKLLPPPPLSFGVLSKTSQDVARECILDPVFQLVARGTYETPFIEIEQRYIEVAVVGRANSGKSSLLNALLGQPGMCKTSSRAGSTRTAMFYRSMRPDQLHHLLQTPQGATALGSSPSGGAVQLKSHRRTVYNHFTFVDLPGWGGIRGMKPSWSEEALQLNQTYLSTRRSLNTVLFCKDVSEGWMPSDEAFFDAVYNSHGLFYLVLTKCDAVSHGRLCEVMRHYYRFFTENRKHARYIYPLIIPTTTRVQLETAIHTKVQPNEATNGMDFVVEDESIDYLRRVVMETSGIIQGNQLRASLQKEWEERMRVHMIKRGLAVTDREKETVANNQTCGETLVAKVPGNAVLGSSEPKTPALVEPTHTSSLAYAVNTDEGGEDPVLVPIPRERPRPLVAHRYHRETLSTSVPHSTPSASGVVSAPPVAAGQSLQPLEEEEEEEGNDVRMFSSFSPQRGVPCSVLRRNDDEMDSSASTTAPLGTRSRSRSPFKVHMPTLATATNQTMLALRPNQNQVAPEPHRPPVCRGVVKTATLQAEVDTLLEREAHAAARNGSKQRPVRYPTGTILQVIPETHQEQGDSGAVSPFQTNRSFRRSPRGSTVSSVQAYHAGAVLAEFPCTKLPTTAHVQHQKHAQKGGKPRQPPSVQHMSLSGDAYLSGGGCSSSSSTPASPLHDSVHRTSSTEPCTQTSDGNQDICPPHMTIAQWNAYKNNAGKTLEGESWYRHMEAHQPHLLGGKRARVGHVVRAPNTTHSGDEDDCSIRISPSRVRRTSHPAGLFRSYAFDVTKAWHGEGSRDSKKHNAATASGAGTSPAGKRSPFFTNVIGLA